MLNKADKDLIKKRFEKSLSTYTQNAIVQRHMAAELLANLIKYRNKNFNSMLEIGCGTGVLTKKIINKLSYEELFINDMIEQPINEISTFSDKIKKLPGDCENIPFPNNLDLVISNATFQWVEDLNSLLNKIHSSLKSDGILAFTTFGRTNLYQIKILTGKSLNYWNKQTIEDILGKNFRIIYSHEETINIEFNSVYDILTHLKLSGVNSLEETKWTKNDLKIFGGKYNKFFKMHNNELILTYQPLYFICAKIN